MCVPPVCEVEERIEAPLYPRIGIALEIAPGAIIDEACRRNASSRRVRSQLAHLHGGELTHNLLKIYRAQLQAPHGLRATHS
jgi:hypothetical protein